MRAPTPGYDILSTALEVNATHTFVLLFSGFHKCGWKTHRKLAWRPTNDRARPPQVLLIRGTQKVLEKFPKAKNTMK